MVLLEYSLFQRVLRNLLLGVNDIEMCPKVQTMRKFLWCGVLGDSEGYACTLPKSLY